MIQSIPFPRILLFCVMLMLTGAVLGQPGGRIEGTITDSASRQGIGSATLTLSGKGLPAMHTLSDSSGKYRFTGAKAGSYTLEIKSVGYHSVTRAIQLTTARQILEMPAVALSADYGKLSEVVVTSQKKLIENKIDRVVFNAENDLTSQGGVATDILKKIPQVSIDIDGNVELAGSGSIKFLINGKPSTAFGSNIADVLQSIPAGEIKSVEVMTTPGAKYDAEGLGGVINIILKNDPKKGLNSSISLTGGSRLENGNANVNLRTGKWGFHAFGGFNTRLPGVSYNSSTRISRDSTGAQTALLTQSGTGRFTRFGSESGIGFDFSPDKKNNFSGSVNYNLFQNHNRGQIHQAQTAADSTGLSTVTNYDNSTESRFRFSGVDLNANYRRTFDKADRELEVGVNSSLGTNQNRSAFDQFYSADGSFQSGNRNQNHGKENQTEITVDYNTPLSEKVKLGTGVKMSIRDIGSHLDAQDKTTEEMLVPDSLLSNSLGYHQKVYAAYAELTFPLGTLLDVKAGTRYERTEITGHYYSPGFSSIANSYNTLVPTVYLSRNLGEGQQIKLGYSSRIERPDYEVLNPFVNTSDPKNLSRGNPALLPQRGYRMELTYTRDFTKQGSLSFGFFYRASNNDIQPYVVYYSKYQVGDSVYSDVNVSTPQNIGLEKNLGFNVYSDLTLWSRFTIRTDFSYFHRFITNQIDKGFNTESNNYRANLNLSYRFQKNLSAEFFSNFRSARNEIQGRYPQFTSYSFAIRKQFWDKKASLALTMINPFNQYLRQRTVLYGTGFELDALRKIPFRSVGLNFTWRFGKLEFKKDEEKPSSGAGE